MTGRPAAFPATRRRRAATRQRVLDAARAEFAERGVFGATVEAICVRAGFTRGAFYSNFADKSEMLRALLEQEHAELLRQLDAGFEQLDLAGIETDRGPSGAGTIAAAEIERLLRSVPVDRGLFLIQAELQIHALRDPAVARDFRRAQARFRDRIAVLLLAGVARAGRELVVDVESATETILAIVERSTRRALLADGHEDPTRLSRQMLPVVLAAMTRPVASPAAGSPATDAGPPAARA